MRCETFGRFVQSFLVSGLPIGEVTSASMFLTLSTNPGPVRVWGYLVEQQLVWWVVGGCAEPIGGEMIRIRLDKTARKGQTVLAQACNLRCVWCHHDYFDHSRCRRPAISNAMFVKGVVHVLRAIGPDEAVVRIAGDGEPTLVGCSELIQLVRLLKQVPEIRYFRLTTNGVLLKDMIAPLAEAGLDSTTISLSSLDPDVFSFYTGVDCLDRVLDSLYCCQSMKFPTKLNVIYNRLNARELQDFLDLARGYSDLPIKFFDLIPATPLDRRLYLPLTRLEQLLMNLSCHVRKQNGAYPCREYELIGGGRVQVKIGWLNGDVVNIAPEYEDCARLAREKGVPAKVVWETAREAAGE